MRNTTLLGLIIKVGNLQAFDSDALAVHPVVSCSSELEAGFQSGHRPSVSKTAILEGNRNQPTRLVMGGESMPDTGSTLSRVPHEARRSTLITDLGVDLQHRMGKELRHRMDDGFATRM
jgi:hypothetical protein